jgi:preprotein translocase subunit SecG
MVFLIALLTVAMVLDCIILIFLVLIQLPKKEAGAGLAFGGAATDALFGAGSGNVLTKITKYAATIFFVMCLLLSVLYNVNNNRNTSSFQENLGKSLDTAPLGAGPARPSSAAVPPAGTNKAISSLESTNVTPSLNNTNPPAAPITNTPK